MGAEAPKAPLLTGSPFLISSLTNITGTFSRIKKYTILDAIYDLNHKKTSLFKSNSISGCIRFHSLFSFLAKNGNSIFLLKIHPPMWTIWNFWHLEICLDYFFCPWGHPLVTPIYRRKRDGATKIEILEKKSQNAP